jgi:signal transduction histidine kinase
MKNTTETAQWTIRYQTALRRYLKREMPSDLQQALKLGKEASALNLETLDLALIHKNALTGLEPDDNSDKTRKQWAEQAKRFFAETVTPIEKTHEASLKAVALIHKITEELHARNADLTASVRLLNLSSVKRHKTEEALNMSKKNRRKLDRKSKILNALLRKKTREVLMMQEKINTKISLELQNEVAQTLLALHLRLLALKTSVDANTQKISKELDDTQQMVRESKQRLVVNVGKIL